MSGDFVGGSAKPSQTCDALICCRCTSVLADSGMAERHVCVTRFWMAGMSFADVEEVEVPDRMRERVRAANHATMTDLWPHGAKLLRARRPGWELYVRQDEHDHELALLEARSVVYEPG